MAYTSEFTGVQMDAVFRRVTNMVAGRATLTASVNGGAASIIIDVEADLSNPVCVGTVRFPDDGIEGRVSIFLNYTPQTHKLMIRLVGEGLKPEHRYDVDYLIME